MPDVPEIDSLETTVKGDLGSLGVATTSMPSEVVEPEEDSEETVEVEAASEETVEETSEETTEEEEELDAFDLVDQHVRGLDPKATLEKSDQNLVPVVNKLLEQQQKLIDAKIKGGDSEPQTEEDNPLADPEIRTQIAEAIAEDPTKIVDVIEGIVELRQEQLEKKMQEELEGFKTKEASTETSAALAGGLRQAFARGGTHKRVAENVVSEGGGVNPQSYLMRFLGPKQNRDYLKSPEGVYNAINIIADKIDAEAARLKAQGTELKGGSTGPSSKAKQRSAEAATTEPDDSPEMDIKKAILAHQPRTKKLALFNN
jgi:hypothetical protein